MMATFFPPKNVVTHFSFLDLIDYLAGGTK